MPKFSLPIFEKILKQATGAGLVRHHVAQSLQWFRLKLSNLRVTPQQAVQDKNKEPFPPLLGQLYLFEYKAKTYPAKLPYYDRYPLALILSRTPNGFIGLNFHYLPPRARALLFQELLKLEKTDWKSKENKIKVTYELLASYQRYKYFRPCIKRYLASHVGKTFVKIEPHEWEVALFLPTERFIGDKKENVWDDSLDLVKKHDRK